MSWNHDRMFQILGEEGAKQGKEVKYGKEFAFPNAKIFVAKNPGGKAVAYVNETSARGEPVSLLMASSIEHGVVQEFYPAGGQKMPRGSALRALDPNKDIYCLRFDREEQFRNFISWYGQGISPTSSSRSPACTVGQVDASRDSGDQAAKESEDDVSQSDSRSVIDEFGEPPNDDIAKLNVYARKVRLGQPTFRRVLLDLYGSKCAVCRQGPEFVLEAAHIWEHSLSGMNHSSNGILLRADIHILFDAGLIKIDPESLEIRVASELMGSEYEKFHGLTLLPRIDGSRPSVEYLARRYS